MSAAYRLVLLRHGRSEWNAKNLFTGWVDVPLDDTGRAEAARGAELLRRARPAPRRRAHVGAAARDPTAELCLDGIDRHWLPVRRVWRLNERHYGALQGKDKKATLEEYGEEQFMRWRRSYDEPPPPLDDDDEWSQVGDPRYADLPDELMPRTECLADVLRPDAAVLVRRDRPGPARRAAPCWWPRTATRCAHWSSTSTGWTSRPWSG